MGKAEEKKNNERYARAIKAATEITGKPWGLNQMDTYHGMSEEQKAALDKDILAREKLKAKK